MKNSEALAYPRPYSHDERPGGGFEGDRVETFQSQQGLTKRELIAAMAMQGMLSNSFIVGQEQSSPDVISKVSVTYADALLTQLDTK